VTPKHSFLAQCKNETYDSETYAFMKQTEHRAKKPCKYDYASFFKRVTPNHSLLALAQCKNETYDSETYAFMKQTEHTAKKPCKYDYASFFKRVTSKHSLWRGAKTRAMTPKQTEHRANTGMSMPKT